MNNKLALVGNPNCGKTTMFNELTGANQYVGNWPGVTVEKKEGKIKSNKDVVLTDLPGIYSLSPYTLEEVITRDYLLNERPGAIINIVDASNIERNLYLTTQLRELGIPIIVALNMMDMVEKAGTTIDINALSKELGCKVIPTTATKGDGLDKVIETALAEAAAHEVTYKNEFSKETETALSKIEEIIKSKLETQNTLRWHAVKLFERDEKEEESFGSTLSDSEKKAIEKIISDIEDNLDDDSESIITSDRYEYVTKIVNKSVKKSKAKDSTSDKIDRIVTNRWLGLPIFALIMFIIYYVSIGSVGALFTDYVNETLFGEIVPTAVEGFLVNIDTAEWLQKLIIDGIIGGVGAVLGFLPQIIILFIFLSILEDCGYMARVAFVMDRIFRKFGLSGKSFIPMIIASGCGIPGVMASRTIENEADRKLTIMTTTFIPCGAKLPVIALIAGSLFADSPYIATSIYFLGIAAVIMSGLILKKFKSFAGDPAPFVMELPPYHMPALKTVFIHMWDRVKSFIIKAGTVIFVSSAVLWFLTTFNWSLEMVDVNDSILASIGNAITPIFAPLGFANWQSVVATITGLIAKENVVATFGIVLNVGEEVAENDPSLLTNLGTMFTAVSGYAFLVFNMICAPCFAAIGAIHREMGSAKWTLITVAYQTGLAYILSFITYQLGIVIFEGASFGIGAIAAIVAIIALIYLMVRKPKYDKKSGVSSLAYSNK